MNSAGSIGLNCLNLRGLLAVILCSFWSKPSHARGLPLTGSKDPQCHWSPDPTATLGLRHFKMGQFCGLVCGYLVYHSTRCLARGLECPFVPPHRVKASIIDCMSRYPQLKMGRACSTPSHATAKHVHFGADEIRSIAATG
eukprot:12398250-Karenia_brevis.AAC.1